MPEPSQAQDLPAPDLKAAAIRRTADYCRLRCACGVLHGMVTHPQRACRVVCYCESCQAYAHFLGQAGRILDERGGSDVLLTRPADVTFTGSLATLACVRLSAKGLLRWYAKCCSTPIGNTLLNHKLSFVGLVHSCLDTEGRSLDEVFGPVTVWNNTAGAKGIPAPRQLGRMRLMLWMMSTLLRARVSGGYRRTRFFNPDTGSPIAEPRVLTPDEHARLLTIVQQA